MSTLFTETSRQMFPERFLTPFQSTLASIGSLLVSLAGLSFLLWIAIEFWSAAQ
ncbi:MAG TPA: hypothetical protein VFG62_26030 [Rhodopila sp.]|jgi:hypothetical protein|nr:hypothetical protein [Rhodopila sp.]